MWNLLPANAECGSRQCGNAAATGVIAETSNPEFGPPTRTKSCLQRALAAVGPARRRHPRDRRHRRAIRAQALGGIRLIALPDKYQREREQLTGQSTTAGGGSRIEPASRARGGVRGRPAGRAGAEGDLQPRAFLRPGPPAGLRAARCADRRLDSPVSGRFPAGGLNGWRVASARSLRHLEGECDVNVSSAPGKLTSALILTLMTTRFTYD